jgi:hypothetical protein
MVISGSDGSDPKATDIQPSVLFLTRFVQDFEGHDACVLPSLGMPGLSSESYIQCKPSLEDTSCHGYLDQPGTS